MPLNLSSRRAGAPKRPRLASLVHALDIQILYVFGIHCGGCPSQDVLWHATAFGFFEGTVRTKRRRKPIVDVANVDRDVALLSKCNPVVGARVVARLARPRLIGVGVQ